MPSVIMMVFTSVYGVVDGFFISNFVGKTPFAAINLVMPFLMILGGVGFMFGTGGSALVARTLGEGDNERANRYFSMIIYVTVITGVLLTALGVIFIRPISELLGATDEMIGDCVLYGRVVLAFNAAFLLQNVFQSFLIAAEKPKLGLYTTVAAGVTNMVLDALFVGVLQWGVVGAALATGVSQCVGGIIPMIYFVRKNSSLLRVVKTRMETRPIVKACINGSSELMSNISMSLVSMLYNFRLIEYAGENGVAAYGVLMYIQFIFVAIFIGYAMGSAPIVSYHYGAGNDIELKNMFKKSVILMGASGVVLMLLARLLAAPLSQMFVGYDRELFEMTTHAFELFSYVFILSGFNIFASSFFTALNNGGVSAAMSFMRTLVFQTLSVIILPIFLDLDGIWLSVTVAEIFSFLIDAIFVIALRKRYRYI